MIFRKLYLTIIIRVVLIIIIPVFIAIPDAFAENPIKGPVSKIQTPVNKDTSGYDVTFYHLNISLTDTSTYVKGNAIMVAFSLKPSLNQVVLALSNYIEIDSVYFNNHKTTFVHHNDSLTVFSILPPKEGEKFSINVYYQGISAGSGFFSGISSRADYKWKVPVTWTLSEPFGAKDWFPCKEDLTDKADSADIFITVPKGLMAGSNGILTEVDTLSDSLLTYKWETRYPIAFYLISATVADFQDYSFRIKLPGENDSLLIQNFIYNRPGALEAMKEDIDNTGKMLLAFSRLFGTYPFYKEKYGHCLAPMGGGMEHQTMTTLASFDFDLVSHELSHQWFGDWVTCATWQDIWVNEGFASYSEYLAREFIKSKESAQQWLAQTHGTAKRARTGSLYVPADQLNDYRIFDYSLTYQKGASVLHMLRYLINDDEKFFAVYRTYLNKFRDSVATADDFRKVAEEVTGLDLKPFFNQWFYGEGYPVFSVYWKSSHDSLYIDSYQSGTSSVTSLFQIPFELKIKFSDGDSALIKHPQNTLPGVV